MIKTQTIQLISRAILQDKQARRKIMFYSCLVTMVLVFGGVFFLLDALQQWPFLFIGYLALCFGSTLFMLLLALWDLLAVRAKHRHEMRELQKRVQNAVNDESNA